MQTTCKERLLALVTPKQQLGYIWHSISWVISKLGHGLFQISASR